MDWLSIAAWVDGAVDSQITAVVSWANAGFAALFSDLSALNFLFGGLRDWAANAFGSLVTFLTNLWTWLRDHILRNIIDRIQKIHNWLKKFLQPLVDLIERYRKMLRDLWMIYVRPIYDFLQRLRRALVLFRLLGFKWAQRLDARIVKLEAALTDAFFAVYSNLNVLSNWINYILDPTGIFQPDVWLRSISQSIGAIIGLALDKMQTPGWQPSSTHLTLPPNYYDRTILEQRCKARLVGATVEADETFIVAVRQTTAQMGYHNPWPHSIL